MREWRVPLSSENERENEREKEEILSLRKMRGKMRHERGLFSLMSLYVSFSLSFSEEKGKDMRGLFSLIRGNMRRKMKGKMRGKMRGKVRGKMIHGWGLFSLIRGNMRGEMKEKMRGKMRGEMIFIAHVVLTERVGKRAGNGNSFRKQGKTSFCNEENETSFETS